MSVISNIAVHLYDGTRELLPAPQDFLLTARNSASADFKSRFVRANPVTLQVPFRDDGSSYTVLASLKRHEDAGYMPVQVAKDGTEEVHLMLLARDAPFDFSRAGWGTLQSPEQNGRFAFLNSEPNAQDQFEALRTREQECVSCLLNITAAIADIPDSNLLQRFKGITLERLGTTDGVRPDRFFAWVDRRLKEDVEGDTAHFTKANHLLQPQRDHQFQGGLVSTRLTYNSHFTSAIAK